VGAFEHRLAACIASGGVFSLLQVFADSRGLREEAERYVTDPPEELDKSVKEVMKHPSEPRWGVEDGMRKFNAKAPHEYVLKLKAYSMADCADKITVPHLSPTPKRDTKFPGQARRLYEALRGEKGLCSSRSGCRRRTLPGWRFVAFKPTRIRLAR